MAKHKPRRMTAAMRRKAAAYHEAGHAVVAVLVAGWDISPGGVYIEGGHKSGRGFSGHRLPAWDANSEWRHANVYLAGRIAENKWHGLGKELTDDELGDIIADLRGHKDPYWYDGDGADLILLLIRLNPDASDAELISRYRQHGADAAANMEAPEIWPAIERLAAELLATGRVDRDTAHRLIGAAPRWTALPPPSWSGVRRIRGSG
jgi:hypothetical protein